MTDDLGVVFASASTLAAQGEYEKAATEYERFLRGVVESRQAWDHKDVDSAVRSASFNLAQVCNHLSRFREALEQANHGLLRSPSQIGRAIGLAAKGEALCGLGQMDEGRVAFDQAVQTHPIIGRLNVADSMTRVSTANLLDDAASLLLDVEHLLMKDACQSNKPRANNHMAELYTIRGKICVRRGQLSEAKKLFEQALQIDGSYEDARLQIRMRNDEVWRRAAEEHEAGVLIGAGDLTEPEVATRTEPQQADQSVSGFETEAAKALPAPASLQETPPVPTEQPDMAQVAAAPRQSPLQPQAAQSTSTVSDPTSGRSKPPWRLIIAAVVGISMWITVSGLKTVILPCAVMLSVVAGWTDFRSGRIPNWLTVPGLVAGVALNMFFGGWTGLKASLLGAFLGLLLLLPFVLVRSLGAGGWKLSGALGAFVGPGVLVKLLIASVCVAAAMSLALVIHKGRVRETLRNLGRWVASLVRFHMPGPEVSRENLKIPYGVALALTVVLYGIAWSLGWTA
jgi:prepilin peptidase CpaA